MSEWVQPPLEYTLDFVERTIETFFLLRLNTEVVNGIGFLLYLLCVIYSTKDYIILL